MGASPATMDQEASPTSSQEGRSAWTYKDAGVDIQREDQAIFALTGALQFARQGVGAPLGEIGHFAGLIEFGDYALALCTDGVGSKLEIANKTKKWDTVGIDCVAMNVNDALCVGAEPLAFVDYLAVEDPNPEIAREIGVGLAEGSRQANISLIGGETATLPGIVHGFDLAGTCLAYAKKDKLIPGKDIQAGDVLIGLASSGIHSNGYTLVRKVIEGGKLDYNQPWPGDDYPGMTIGEVLLIPTRIYVKEIMELLKSEVPVHGLSHITGSGLRKLRRIHPEVQFNIDNPLDVPPVFKFIQELGGIENHEMYSTFNMGMGFFIVVPEHAAEEAMKILGKNVNYPFKIVGRVSEGKGVSHPIGGLH